MHKKIVQQLTDTLHTHFHFSHFREGQLESLVSLMTHGRLLCIQPTGYGKSLLYQLPSLLLDGVTLVISPLLALMRDQVDQLNKRFSIPAVSFNTDQSREENRVAKKSIQSGKVRIVFIAPEQLASLEQFEFLKSLPIQLLVVDEAHCISTWGHDFRPSYRQIIQLTYALTHTYPNIKLLALTATANKKTEEDIKEQLTVQGKDILVQRESMNRPNIRLTVIQTSGKSIKLTVLIQLLNQLTGSGLVYCSTRENTEFVAEYLQNQGIKAAAYHAGIAVDMKKEIQQGFITDKYPVIAATNALGMGIDKSNLRYVIHFDFPGSITAYYQEVGRCGRDGLPAEGILLYDHKDSQVQNYFINSSQPSRGEFEYVLNIIMSSLPVLHLNNIKQATGMHPTKLNVIIAELIEQGFLKKTTQHGRQTYQFTQKSSALNLSRYETQLLIRKSELSNMQYYAERKEKCLMATLRKALGDSHTQSCNQCSHCRKSSFNITLEKDFILAVSSWVEKRVTPLVLSQKNKNIITGIALLDGKMRSEEFMYFMRERTHIQTPQMGVLEKLWELLKTTLDNLSQHYTFSCIISIPSRTWAARNAVLHFISKYLNIPYYDLLTWKMLPEARQGELMNNEQRQYNVKERMALVENKKIPKGTIILFDDYIGSGATMSEACRILSKHKKNKIMPFTIAAVKWRLGKSGMI
jgi:ATP-dependent DNA helicase RecQ